MKPKHLILFDESCAFCRRCVNLCLKMDTEHRLLFAPLNGMTAREAVPRDLIEKNSFVLVENYESSSAQIWIYAKGLFRLMWLLGGCYKTLGLLHFFPGWLIDPLYRAIAKRRRCHSKDYPLKHDKRFLP